LKPAVTPTPGSAPGFSQPLSGFQASPSSRALFHAPTVSELSLQSLPLTKVVYPSRGHQLPCGHPPVCESASLTALLPRISPTPTFKRSCLVPTETMNSLFTRPKPRFPVVLDHQRRDHSLPPASPASKPYSLRESVRTNPSCPVPAVAALLGFFPSEDQTFQALEPLTRPTPKGRTRCLVRRLRNAAKGTVYPPTPGETSPKIRRSRVSFVGSTRSGMKRTAPPLGGNSLSPDLSTERHRPASASRALQCLKRWQLSEEIRRPPMRFLAFSRPQGFEALAGPGYLFHRTRRRTSPRT